MNISIDFQSDSWSQASLPVSLGGLGFRAATQLATSCYLSSTAAARDLVSLILTHFSPPSLSLVNDARHLWCQRAPSVDPPSGDDTCLQNKWDWPQVASTLQSLLESSSDDLIRARLLAVSVPESGAWLNAFPISSPGLRLDDDSVRISTAVCLGLPTCTPHNCRLCGAPVDKLGIHGLHCKRGGGRCHHHAALNDLLQRSFNAAGVPSTLEPAGLSRSDGKRPDGLTLVPWSRGRPLVWDLTVPDTPAPSYRAQASTAAGNVAKAAEIRKQSKYSSLSLSYSFSPISIESMGVFGPQSLSIIRGLGRRTSLRTGDPLSTSYLLQRFSITLQRCNAFLILDTLPRLAGA